MRRRKMIAVLLVIATFLLAARELRNRHNRTVAFNVIREMGGQTGSIPDELFGTEYRITFRNREFSAGDL